MAQSSATSTLSIRPSAPSIPSSTPTDSGSAQSSRTTHALPAPFLTSQQPLTLISQGAEALLFRTPFLSHADAALKFRPRKPWRHEVLDRRLTKTRILAEARVLARCYAATGQTNGSGGTGKGGKGGAGRKAGGAAKDGKAGAVKHSGETDGAGAEHKSAEHKSAGKSPSAEEESALRVPALLGLGAEEGWVALEWIHGESVKARLRELKARRVKNAGQRQDRPDRADGSDDGIGEEQRAILRAVGRAVGTLHHRAGVCHGDLTSSNMMLETAAPGRSSSEMEEDTSASSSSKDNTPRLTDKFSNAPDSANAAPRIALIDFGLAQMTPSDEDRAVDLYVLERAFGSTHPELEEAFAEEVLEAYGQSFKGARVVLKRLADVRMRGRKKSMLG